MKNKKTVISVLCYAILILMAVAVLIPILWMLSTALKTSAETVTMPPKWIPQHATLESFKRLWTEYPFGTYFRNSLIIVLISMVVSVFCSSLAGYGLTRFEFKGKNSLMMFVLVTQMFPQVMLLVPFYSLIGKMNLLDTHLGLILVYISFTVPFCTWMMLGFFKALPLELDEAARIDGCSSWQTFRKIIFPLTLPGIASTSIYAFISSWNEYMFAFILTSKPEMKTLSVGIAELNGFQQVRWNDMMAGSLLASLPLIILFVCMQKYFISGLTNGAVKS